MLLIPLKTSPRVCFVIFDLFLSAENEPEKIGAKIDQKGVESGAFFSQDFNFFLGKIENYQIWTSGS